MQQIQSIPGEMPNTKISSRHQTVIPAKIRRALKLKAGDKLIWEITQINNHPRAIVHPPHNWAEYTYGLGKHIWANVDIDAYIKGLRAEWDK